VEHVSPKSRHRGTRDGKLLKYVGENNVLWGTDSIWTGSPQDQIQAWRTFQIAEELRDRHGYPEITPQLRAKVFGLNATRPFLTYGPKTRREFLNLLGWKGEKPGD
jgi:hypothetical protein